MRFKFEFSFGSSEVTGKRECKAMSVTNTAFINLSTEEMKRNKAIIRYSTYKNFMTAIRSYQRFVNQYGLGEERLSVKLLVQYQQWLDDNGICRNTAACYMRFMRAIYNKVYGSDAEKGLFLNITTSNSATSKRSLDFDEVKTLTALQPMLNKCMRRYLDVFLFSVYTYGIPFVDLVRLKHSDIVGGKIIFHRRKTGVPVIIALLPQAADIARRYDDNTSDYIFPFISSKGSYSPASHARYASKLSCYNSALVKIGQMAGISTRLTSYVARHTWASLALTSGVDIAVISQALGHRDIRTTQIYLRQLSHEKMRAAGMKVMEYLAK